MKKAKEEYKKFDPVDYWEWRTTITEMQLAQSKQRESEVAHRLLGKEAELAALRAQLYSRTGLEAAKQKSKEAVDEYDRFKKVLEEKYNISLNEKMIDDFTFEIKPIPDQEAKEG